MVNSFGIYTQFCLPQKNEKLDSQLKYHVKYFFTFILEIKAIFSPNHA